ncbi:MAG: agmatinase [Thermococcaceae archaeon]|jgi:agmatinase|uniref:arginase family protein n=1 Tax=Thermococcus TaxID=2263 RepID=UPI0005B282E6|nr:MULTISPECIES: arginase family protein [Thermococcus]KUJ99859.1 MAG: Arginase [Thermococcales archaeon 44_46]MDK2783233.1 agmatinase [Thermococcaceae archaeon]MCA6213088.1 arginase family protein [Thermococcus bergensis]MDK2853362.1 agmatinase [Thermococcaceae archaeon]MDN5319966.1 agmatinase [Thermococcaceae archaeon]
MVTFIPFGEKPNKEGVMYTIELLKKNKLIEDFMIVESNNVELLADRVPLDKCYIIGEHLATYGIIKRVKPQSIISIDAHTDLMHDYLDHGSWLAYALEEKAVNRAAVVGPVLMVPTTEGTSLWVRRVKIFPALPRTRKVRGKWKAYKSLKTSPIDEIIAEMRRYLGKEVYLTVDMDVLKPEYKIARFQHGELTLEELLELISEIKKNFKIVACDIAEISDKIKRSKLGKKALIEVYRALIGE